MGPWEVILLLVGIGCGLLGGRWEVMDCWARTGGGVGCERGLGGLGLGLVPGDREKNDVTGDWDRGRRAGDAGVSMRCCGTPSFCCWRSLLSFQISVADSARILDSVRMPCCRLRSFLSFKIRRAGRRRWSSSIKLARMS